MFTFVIYFIFFLPYQEGKKKKSHQENFELGLTNECDIFFTQIIE